jgi:hypothetical protein
MINGCYDSPQTFGLLFVNFRYSKKLFSVTPHCFFSVKELRVPFKWKCWIPQSVLTLIGERNLGLCRESISGSKVFSSVT